MPESERGIQTKGQKKADKTQQQLKRAKANQKNNSSILFRNNENNIND